MRGRFRVENLVIYQGKSPDDKEKFTKAVGKSKPGPGPRPTRTLLVLEEFVVFGRGGERKVIKGNAGLERDNRDENHGSFTDGDGFKWDIQCTKIQE